LLDKSFDRRWGGSRRTPGECGSNRDCISAAHWFVVDETIYDTFSRFEFIVEGIGGFIEESTTQNGRLPDVRICSPPIDIETGEISRGLPDDLFFADGNPYFAGMKQGPPPANTDSGFQFTIEEIIEFFIGELTTQNGHLPAWRISPRPIDIETIKISAGLPDDLFSADGNPSLAGVKQGPPPANADFLAHIQNRGDVYAKFGDWIGGQESSDWIEGFAIAAPDGVDPDDLTYQAVLGIRMASPWAKAGQYCGSRCKGSPLIGLRIKLSGKAAEMYDISYSVRFACGTVVGPVGNDEFCADVENVYLCGLQVNLSPKTPKRPGNCMKMR
jgi:hypothetical protein